MFRHSPLSSEMRYAALLRGINVGGNKKVSMAELRDFAATLGLDDPRTLLNSGNLVFASKTAALKLESVLETETKKRFGLETRYFLRAPEEWQSAVEANPFRDEAASDPARLGARASNAATALSARGTQASDPPRDERASEAVG